MNNPRPPLFLARQSYRRRRLIDATRLLPIVGVFLFLLPILWQPAETPKPDTAWGGVYLFSVWIFLIVAAAVLSLILARGEESGKGDEVSESDKNTGPG
jgi:hypothetical protein